jgi:hypothetical protein
LTKRKKEVLTKKSVDKMRMGMKGQRICMRDDGMIFSPTLEEIEKHHYRLIEDIPKEEWGLDDPLLDSHERKAIEKTMQSLVQLNGILESGDNKIER